jgi:hypothetical protein
VPLRFDRFGIWIWRWPPNLQVGIYHLESRHGIHPGQNALQWLQGGH